MKILLAADGSAYTGKAANFIASHLAGFLGNSELHLLHVALPLPIGLAVKNARKIVEGIANVALSLPHIIGRSGILSTLQPPVSGHEKNALRESAALIKRNVTALGY